MANRKQRKALLYGNYSTRKLFQLTQFSDKTIRLTVYAKGRETFFYVLSIIYLCLEIGMCELGTPTSIFSGGGGKDKKGTIFTKLRADYQARMFVKGPGIVMCPIISQLDCKKVLVFTRVFPAFRPHFDYGFAFCYVCHSHFQPRVLASYFVFYIKQAE